jgi:hypothetical protein
MEVEMCGEGWMTEETVLILFIYICYFHPFSGNKFSTTNLPTLPAIIILSPTTFLTLVPYLP